MAEKMTIIKIQTPNDKNVFFLKFYMACSWIEIEMKLNISMQLQSNMNIYMDEWV